MTLGSVIGRVLPVLRANADSMMCDRVTVSRQRPGGPGVDPATAQLIPALDVIVAAYPCRARSYEPFEATPEVGGQTVAVQRTSARFPAGGDYHPRVDDVVRFDSAPLDPALIGRTFRVASVPQNSLSTAYRVHLEEVTR